MQYSEGHPIRFLLNGEFIHVQGVEPVKSVLHYLREIRQLTGTKEGCAEGDCGACTVVLAELSGEAVNLRTVNACIQFLPTLDGKALFTVEYLRQSTGNGELHPVQQAMVDEHGSQCGFCTPGFIMSLWNVYNQHQARQSRPQRSEVRSALTGNLCRCTGYRPILAAADKMFDLPVVPFDLQTLKQQLKQIQRTDSGYYVYQDQHFFTPRTLQDLLSLKAQYPEGTLLAGGTDVGLWVNKQFRELNPVIYVSEVAELRELTIMDNAINIGAGVSLTEVYQILQAYYPQMNALWERFASQPIRNIGTLGGNVANGSPIGDSMPALIALGARVVLQSMRGERTLLLEDLYLDYMKKDLAVDEIVSLIQLPLPTEGLQFRCYKLSKRHDSDISAVFAAFAMTLEENKVQTMKIAFGGMAATPKRAPDCEQALIGKTWDEATVQQAMQVLQGDYTPLTDMRATGHNRMQSAQNLLYRFYLETHPSDPLPPEAVDVFQAV